MTKSKITQFFDGTAAAVDTVGTPAEIYPQRLLDETGAIQLSVDGDPGAGTGKVVIEGKVDANATYVEVASFTFSQVAGANPRSIIEADVDILPYMRAAMRTEGGGFTATGFNVDFWLME